LITCITTCKGRLSHLKRSLPSFASEFQSVIVVDWNCPDHTTEWIENLNHPNITPLFHKEGTEVFHKTAAMNVGAKYAIAHGATQLCFIDADTLIIRDNLRAELETLEQDQIAITGPKTFAHSQLVGFLCVESTRFQRIKGFNETFIGWGYEDLDIRMRLICGVGCKPIWIDETMFASITHDNTARRQFQPDTLVESNKRNRDLFRAGLRVRLSEHWSQELKDALPYK